MKLFQGDHWLDGKVFRPERFLDNTGKIVRDEHLIPFSIGRRQCLGETLAKVREKEFKQYFFKGRRQTLLDLTRPSCSLMSMYNVNFQTS